MTPAEINREWTEELLTLMVRARTRRIRRATRTKTTDPDRSDKERDAITQAFTPQRVKVRKA